MTLFPADERHKHRRILTAIGIVLALASMTVGTAAFAKITFNTIDPVATVTDNGRRIIVTGPIACTEGEGCDLRIVVSQRSTGAVAEGRTRLTCSGENDQQQWSVEARAQGNETFEAGPATAVAFASHRIMVNRPMHISGW